MKKGNSYLVRCHGSVNEVNVIEETLTSYQLLFESNSKVWVTKRDFKQSYLVVEDLSPYLIIPFQGISKEDESYDQLNVNELRLGNRIYVDIANPNNKKHIVEVTALCATDIWCVRHPIQGTVKWNPKSCAPIPLSIAVLIDLCGFEKNKYNEYHKDNLSLSLLGSVSLYYWNIWEGTIDEEDCVPIRYFHQLQNLYYETHRKEMEFRNMM